MFFLFLKNSIRRSTKWPFSRVPTTDNSFEYFCYLTGGETKKEGSQALTPTESSFENLTDERH